MKKISLATILLAISAGTTFAADLPSRKEPVAALPTAPMWTGFYAGLNAGASWSNNNTINQNAFPVYNYVGGTEVSLAPSKTLVMLPGPQSGSPAALSMIGSRNLSANVGFIGGGQVGYNYQIHERALVGIEADIQGIASGNTNSNFFSAAPDPNGFYDNAFSPFASIGQVNKSTDYLGTVRGRLGWLVTPALLVYGTGGLAYGGVRLSSTFMTSNIGNGFENTFVGSSGQAVFGPGFGNASYANTLVGWSAGGGIEWMFAPNWSAKVEYLYYDLGSITTNTSLVAGFSTGGTLTWAYAANASARFNGNIARAGVNYHFNWATNPVVAKF